EIDLFLDTDDLMPPGIKNNNYDSKGDILFVEKLLSNDSISFPENESSNFDHHDDPSFPRPPPEPPDLRFSLILSQIHILINSYPKFNYLLELAHIDPIPPEIEEVDFDLEEEIRLVENLFDSQMEEIDLFLDTDDLMPPGIKNNNYDSKGDILFIDPHYFNAESNLIESLLNRDILINSYPKFNYLLELAHIDPITPEIEEVDFDLEEEIRLVENLLYDNSSPRPPKELNAEIADMIVESLSLCLLSPLSIVTLK
nr:hypothetical protein [Tanacetum cinerariifolium]